MTSQNLPTIKTITSTEQFDYLKKQLEVSVLPHFFTDRQMLKQKIQSFASLLYILGLFSSFIPFIPLKKEQSQLLFLGAAICYGILLLQNFVSSSLKKYYLRQYQLEIDAHQYLATQGEILQIHVWNQKQKWLELTVEFQDISNDYIRKKFRIPYPQLEKSKNLLDPEQLIGQKSELCLLPQSYQLLQIRLLPTDTTKLAFFHSKSALFFSQNQLWSLHCQGIQIKSSVCTFDVQQISFNRLIDKPTFIIQLHCNNASDFHISSELSNFPIFERALFECFEGIDFNFYQKLKYSNHPQQQEIWHSPFPSLSAEQKHKQNQQLEHSIGLCVGICIVVSFIVMFSIHIIIGVMSLIFSFIILMTFYFYHLNSRKYFDYYQHPNL
ncbi:hypothetical protein [Acinetobacter modestus]|uniref:hypothetical protein n=1 Tax=Acinetobacter modestus TaxID=1776740 RepID=UPI001F4AE3F5|nr:hypothetical protein [Acinetobacter modestus]MCH7332622.1 hypothetical protein [Acinetobacter modestus]